MESVSVRKNILMGCALLFWPLALCLLITGKADFDKEEKRVFVCSLITVVLIAVLTCIPFIGWVGECVVTIFWIIAIIKMFTSRFDYKMILVYQMSKWFIKD